MYQVYMVFFSVRKLSFLQFAAFAEDDVRVEDVVAQSQMLL